MNQRPSNRFGRIWEGVRAPFPVSGWAKRPRRAALACMSIYRLARSKTDGRVTNASRITVAALCLTGCAPDLGPDQTNAVSRFGCHLDGETAEVAAALRNDGDGWYAVNDEAHSPLNVRSVTTTDGAIVVVFSFTGRHVQAFIATPDEALAGRSFFVGSSVGLTEAKISLARVNRAINPKSISTDQHPWSNIWVYGRFSGASCPA